VSVQVRALAPADLPVFLELIDGLADYEKLPRPDADARQRLSTDAFGDKRRFWGLLAEVDGTAVGYAIYFFTYSSFLARPTLYLEDIFVLPDARGKGAGLALFRTCVRTAVSEGCGRMEWQVLSWNTPSIQFYERLGAHHMETWLPFRLDAETLATLTHSDSGG
jgi:GNAT superfamily N-acetyltransferase